MRENREKGFTLVELIVVIAVMAVLVGVLAPAYLRYVEKARQASDLATMRCIYDAVKMEMFEHETSDILACLNTGELNTWHRAFFSGATLFESAGNNNVRLGSWCKNNFEEGGVIYDALVNANVDKSFMNLTYGQNVSMSKSKLWKSNLIKEGVNTGHTHLILTISPDESDCCLWFGRVGNEVPSYTDGVDTRHIGRNGVDYSYFTVGKFPENRIVGDEKQKCIALIRAAGGV